MNYFLRIESSFGEPVCQNGYYLGRQICSEYQYLQKSFFSEADTSTKHQIFRNSRFFNKVTSSKRVHGKTTYEWHTNDIRVHTRDRRMTYEYIRITYGWHTSMYEWHTDDIEYIRVTHGWHTSTSEYIRVTYGWHRSYVMYSLFKDDS